MSGASGYPQESAPGHKASQHLIAGEAYRRIIAGEAPEGLSDFTQQLLAWLRDTYPTAAPMTAKAAEDQIRDLWHRRHEMIRGG